MSLLMDGESILAKRKGCNPRTRVPEQQPIFLQKDRQILTTQDAGTKFSLWASQEHYSAGRGIGLKIEAEHRPKGSDEKSKIEINLAYQGDSSLDQKYNGQYILRNGQQAFLGFAVQLDPTAYENPTRSVIHFQTWQCCGSQPPPLSLRAMPDRIADSANVNFELLKRDNSFLSKDKALQYGEALSFWNGEKRILLRKGRWYFIVFRMHPDPLGRGEIDMWIDGDRVLTYRGAWGYSPSVEKLIKDSYAVKLGIYRPAQGRSQQIFLDDIRWGRSFDSVNAMRPSSD